MAMHVLVAKLATVSTCAFVFVTACGDASVPGPFTSGISQALSSRATRSILASAGSVR
ncbi:hypothetical protein AKJ09_10662 [Labilithrix luteola]|uniref:Lipoprotein n=1 Tax=Labilithrix luteola TaxID=1391654 RepID=A0A0K1QE12_9BACT|nr:hypothetical protein AKJ09_10662 [Labilithrix luteola]